MPTLIANRQYSGILSIASKILGLTLILMLSACTEQERTFSPKKPYSIEDYANGAVDGDPCAIKTAKAILKSGLKYPNIIYPEKGRLLSRDIWAGSTLLRFEYESEGWGLYNGGMTPKAHPLSSNLLNGSVEGALKLSVKEKTFKDIRGGGTLYGDFTCFTPSENLLDIEASTLPELTKTVEDNIAKRYSTTVYGQRRRKLIDINFLEIVLYKFENDSKQVAIYLPLRESTDWGDINRTYQPIVCQRAYAPDEVARVLPFQCSFSLRVGPDAVLRVRTYQQMLPYLPRFRSLAKTRLTKYIQQPIKDTQ